MQLEPKFKVGDIVIWKTWKNSKAHVTDIYQRLADKSFFYNIDFNGRDLVKESELSHADV